MDEIFIFKADQEASQELLEFGSSSRSISQYKKKRSPKKKKDVDFNDIIGWKTTDSISQDYVDYKFSPEVFRETKGSSKSIKNSSKIYLKSSADLETIQIIAEKPAKKRKYKQPNLNKIENKESNLPYLQTLKEKKVKTNKVFKTQPSKSEIVFDNPMFNIENALNFDTQKNVNYNEVKGLLTNNARKNIITGEQLIAQDQLRQKNKSYLNKTNSSKTYETESSSKIKRQTKVIEKVHENSDIEIAKIRNRSKILDEIKHDRNSSDCDIIKGYDYNRKMLQKKFDHFTEKRNVNMDNMSWQDNLTVSMVEDIFKNKDSLPENFVNKKNFQPKDIETLRKNYKNTNSKINCNVAKLIDQRMKRNDLSNCRVMDNKKSTKQTISNNTWKTHRERSPFDKNVVMQKYYQGKKQVNYHVVGKNKMLEKNYANNASLGIINTILNQEKPVQTHRTNNQINKDIFSYNYKRYNAFSNKNGGYNDNPIDKFVQEDQEQEYKSLRSKVPRFKYRDLSYDARDKLDEKSFRGSSFDNFKEAKTQGSSNNINVTINMINTGNNNFTNGDSMDSVLNEDKNYMKTQEQSSDQLIENANQIMYKIHHLIPSNSQERKVKKTPNSKTYKITNNHVQEFINKNKKNNSNKFNNCDQDYRLKYDNEPLNKIKFDNAFLQNGLAMDDQINRYKFDPDSNYASSDNAKMMVVTKL